VRKLPYSLVDVFTDRPFGGNQLAVFTDARDLSPDVMQALAKELNLSETSFVLSVSDPAHFDHVCYTIHAFKMSLKRSELKEYSS
jgi:trans-2,3-dihydro-3-hydroxyanthranilate isomerase